MFVQKFRGEDEEETIKRTTDGFPLRRNGFATAENDKTKRIKTKKKKTGETEAVSKSSVRLRARTIDNFINVFIDVQRCIFKYMFSFWNWYRNYNSFFFLSFFRSSLRYNIKKCLLLCVCVKFSMLKESRREWLQI